MFHTKFYENLKSQYFNCFSTTEKYLVKVLFQKYKAISAVCLLDKQSVWNVLFSSFPDIKLLYDISYLKFYINFAEKTNGCSFPLASKNTFLKLRFKSTRFFYYKVKSDCLLNKKKKKKYAIYHSLSSLLDWPIPLKHFSVSVCEAGVPMPSSIEGTKEQKKQTLVISFHCVLAFLPIESRVIQREMFAFHVVVDVSRIVGR